jgi:hypothetical protein
VANLTRNQFPCEFMIPLPSNPLQVISYDQVMVIHTTVEGPEEVPYVTSLAACNPAHGGWYYDVAPYTDPNGLYPSRFIMCPCTCASFNGGRIDVYIGCHPQMGGPA